MSRQAMRSRTFTLKLTQEEAAQLAAALSGYATAAFPPGGSECAQVSRETLLESAREIAAQGASAAGAHLRRRQRTLLKAAVQWYFSEEGPGDPARCAPLLARFP